jgi:hypothetical protein
MRDIDELPKVARRKLKRLLGDLADLMMDRSIKSVRLWRVAPAKVRFKIDFPKERA